MSTDARTEEYRVSDTLLPIPRRIAQLPSLPIPDAPTRSCRDKALAAHAESSDRAAPTCDHLSLGPIDEKATTAVGANPDRTAWTYRYPARVSETLRARIEGLPKTVRDIAWKAQLRLGHRYRKLQSRKLHQNKIIVAIARELSGFLWDIARHVTITA